MKIFISHSSQDVEYGDLLVNFLTGIGVRPDDIIFTSNIGYGIPIGRNIFDWLKSQIQQKPYVIYLLSPRYYSSIACLNEMGAAWGVENNHAAIFTPDFNLECEEFQKGALDPREMGFYLNNKEGLLSFVDLLKKDFKISDNSVLVNQKIASLLHDIRYITLGDDEPSVVTSSVSCSDSPRIIELNEKILSHLLELRKKQTFTFSMRKRNNEGRLEKGYWFRGGDYISVGFVKRDDPLSKLCEVSFVVNLINQTPDVYLQLSLRSLNDEKIKGCYDKIINELGIEEFGLYHKKTYKNDVIGALNQFLRSDWPVFVKHFAECGITKDMLISENDFDIMLDRVERYRGNLNMK